MIRFLSWLEILILVVFSAFVGFSISKYLISNNPESVSVAVVDDTDKPIVIQHLVTPLSKETGQMVYGHVSCNKNTDRNTSIGFSADCSGELNDNRKFALPNLQSIFSYNADIEEGSYGKNVYNFDNYTYITASGYGYFVGSEKLFVFDHATASSVQELFDCPVGICESLTYELGGTPVYFERTIADKELHIYRGYAVNGKFQRDLIASIPNANNDWQLGVICTGEPCVGGRFWISFLDKDNIILRFDRQTNPGSEFEDRQVETKYVHMELK